MLQSKWKVQLPESVSNIFQQVIFCEIKNMMRSVRIYWKNFFKLKLLEIFFFFVHGAASTHSSINQQSNWFKCDISSSSFVKPKKIKKLKSELTLGLHASGNWWQLPLKKIWTNFFVTSNESVERCRFAQN